MNEELKSKRWERLRKSVLRRDYYLDQIMLRYGKRVEATTVHHIFPREFFPEYTYEPWNLISLSQKTHNELHDRESHRLTDKGWRLMKKTADAQGIEIPDGLREIFVAKR